MKKPTYVTRPFLPPLEELQPYLERIWANRQLTNGGPFHQEFEQELCDYLGVGYISLFTNGTLVLADIPGIRYLPLSDCSRRNYAYFIIMVDPEYPISRDELYTRLRQSNIFARRHFYPLISNFPFTPGWTSLHWEAQWM